MTIESVTYEPDTGLFSVIGFNEENNIIGPKINITNIIKP